MTIKEVIQQVEKANNPVAKALHKGEHFKVLAIGFKSGMILKEHEAHLPSKFIVVYGQVIYTEPERKVTLNSFDEIEIAINTKHSVEATEDSLCLLTQGE